MSNLDDRLSRAFRAIDVPVDFETRVMAQVHAVKARSPDSQAGAARAAALQSYDAAGRNLHQWYRTALRMLTLDALGGAAVLIVLIAALPRVLSQFGVNGPGYALALLALGVGAVGVRFASLQGRGSTPPG